MCKAQLHQMCQTAAENRMRAEKRALGDLGKADVERQGRVGTSTVWGCEEMDSHRR